MLGHNELEMLTNRSTNILNLIVDDYINSGAPISSRTLVHTHSLEISSATIRNEVAGLEQGGYIKRPHTSAGSVPLEKGYRIYVETADSANDDIELPVRRSIKNSLVEVERDIDEWTEVASALLAGLVNSMAIVTFPKAAESRVRTIQLVRLQEFLTLLIVVLNESKLRRQLVPLERRLGDSELEESANRIVEMVRGCTWNQIDTERSSLTVLEEEILDSITGILREEDRANKADHYMDGLRNLFSQPEFADNAAVAGFVEGIEDGSLAQAILDQTPDSAVVKVVIGHENPDDLLQPMGVVIGRYGVPGEIVGSIAAVGPVRMQYKKAISSIELMSDVMSELVGGVSGI